MALIHCPECNGEVSTTAADCPHCAYRLKTGVFCPSCAAPSERIKICNHTTGAGWTVVIVAIAGALFFHWSAIFLVIAAAMMHEKRGACWTCKSEWRA